MQPREWLFVLVVFSILFLSGCAEKTQKYINEKYWESKSNIPPPNLLPNSAMYRANLQRTGVYDESGPTHFNKVAWKYEPEESDSQSFTAPIVFNGVVYFGGGSDKYVYALDTKKGEEKWKYNPGGNVSTPTIDDGIVYFANKKEKEKPRMLAVK